MRPRQVSVPAGWDSGSQCSGWLAQRGVSACRAVDLAITYDSYDLICGQVGTCSGSPAFAPSHGVSHRVPAIRGELG